MKYFVIGIGCLVSTLLVATGCYLSLSNSTGWVFPIMAGLGALAATGAFSKEVE